MSEGEPPVRIMPGAGVVARIGPGVLLVLGSPAQAGLEPLLSALRSTCSDQLAPGRALVRRVAAHLFEADPASVPVFAVLAPTEQGWALLLHGDIEAVVDQGDSQERLSGTDAATWVDRIIPAGFTSLHVGSVGSLPDRADGPYELTAGIVPASGVVIVPADQRVPAAPVPAPPPASTRPPTAGLGTEPDPTLLTPGAPPAQATTMPDALRQPPAVHPQPGAASPFQSIVLAQAAPVEPLPPLPVVGEPARDNEAERSQGALVDGILCEREHFNHPQALYCSACGVSTVHRTRTLVKGPRPPLGVLVGDDGSAYSLGADYLVGREPHEDDAVRRGTLRPLRLLDAERSVSRVHAEIRLQDWDVVVVDRGSANGTFVAERGETTWRRLDADRKEIIPPGTRIAFGKRLMTFETHHQA